MAAKIKVDQIETVDATDSITINNTVVMASGKTLPAASLTGTLPAISGANLTNLPADATKLPLAGGTMTGNIAHASNFTLDVGGDIILDSDNGGIKFSDAGTNFGQIQNGNGSQFIFQGYIADQDMFLKVNDGGTTINAITIDSSEAGYATFNNWIKVNDRIVGNSNLVLNTSDGNEKIHLDASGYIKFETAGTERMRIDSSGNVGIGHPLNTHQQKLVVKKTAAITSLASGGGINIVNEQGAGNFANLRFTGSNQNAYIGYRDGTNDQDRRLSIGVGADAEHFSFSQAGLKFNGDTAEANGLDDYEEGFVSNGIANVGMPSGYTQNRYTKIGNVCTVTGQIRASTNGGGTYSVNVNLPFAAESNQTNARPFAAASLNCIGMNLDSGYNGWSGKVDPGASLCQILQHKVNADSVPFRVNQIDTNAFQLTISVTYITA